MWCLNRTPIKEFPKRILQRYHFQTYQNKRDLIRIQLNNPARWNQYCTPLMASLNRTKTPTFARTRESLVTYATNLLAKRVATEDKYYSAKCLLCNSEDTHAHFNTICSHPELIDIRELQRRRKIEEHLLCLWHLSLPHTQLWVRLLVDFAEDHL